MRWRVRDVTRDEGAVLEATPMRGATEGVPVRVHPVGRFQATATDVISPWVSPEAKDDADAPRCLRVRLVNDPWAGGGAGAALVGGTERYVVELDAL